MRYEHHRHQEVSSGAWLTAILCADVYGYSRLMGEDEEGTLRTLSAYRKITDSLIERHHGRFINSAGDSVLAEFASVVEAVTCAVSIQTALRTENAEVPQERRMEFRIGVNLGDVMVEGEQIYGDGVNVAARLESLADPGGVCISGTVHERVRDKLTLAYEDRGEQTVKNIARPVRVWRVLLDEAAPSRGEMCRRTRRYWRGGVLSLAGIAIAITTFVIVQHVSLKPPHTSASIPPQEKPALPLPSIPSIAVLPFTNLSGDPQQEYFSDGIANQLIDEFSRLPDLFVIARNSSFAYKGRPVKEYDIGRELRVKYLLEGNVRKAAEQVRIGVELVDASSGTEMWTQRYDRPLKDIFAVQEEIVRRVVTTLGLIFKLQEMNVPWSLSKPTGNLEAFDDYLRAAEHFVSPSQRGMRSVWTKVDNTKARQWLEKAIELDPKFAQAYGALAVTYYFDVWNQWSANPQADLERSRQLAQKAPTLDDSNIGALIALSWVDMLQGRSAQSVAEAERAVATNPNDAAAYFLLSDVRFSYGRAQEALPPAEKAMRLDPAAGDFYALAAGTAMVYLGRYEEGIRFLKRNLAAYPDDLAGHLTLIIAYAELGRDHDARVEAAEVMRISPHFALALILGMKGATVPKNAESDWRKAGLK